MSTDLTDLIVAGPTGQLDPIPETITRELVATFLAGCKASTLATYRQSLGDFARFVNAARAEDAARILLGRAHGDANHLALLYRADLVQRDLAASTVNGRLAAVRSLVKLGRTLGLVSWTLDVANVKARAYRDTRGPGRDGVRAVMESAGSRGDAKGVRDLAILKLLHDLGLRRAEVVGLDVEHVDLDARLILVQGKGQNDRESCTLPEPTAAALKAWLDARGVDPGPLFVNFDRAGKGSRLSGRSVHRIVKRLGQQAGVHARPHGIRHAAITEALDRTGGDVRAVQKFSRHADVRTLQHYDDARQDLAGKVARLVADAASETEKPPASMFCPNVD
ncbi:MAG: tyrosine-type recombinase/integrase [Candidatus Nealsonbacteria bacterium]|nr:tyrosine-type recombinase/integrase [Candidatus Nealsonbacteria bacterium]